MAADPMVRPGEATRGRPPSNRLLDALTDDDRALLDPHLVPVLARRGDCLVEAGDEVTGCLFPCDAAMVSLIVALADGTRAETATVGREGALGGVVSSARRPAFATSVVQIGGTLLRIDTEALEAAKDRSPTLRDMLARYADCLIAQVLQSVACNVLHRLEARLCRWLLTTQDRVGGSEVPLTQEFMAEMLGVQRTTVTAAVSTLQARGLIAATRGRITVLDRAALEATACDCHGAVVAHFERLLPGVYPIHPPAAR